MRSYFFILILASFAFLADQSVKLYCQQKFLPNQFINVMGMKEVKLTRVMNPGVMFESLSQFPPGENKALTRYMPTAIVAVFALMFLFLQRGKSSTAEFLFFALFLAGSLSNIFDHWRSDFVMDTFGLWLPGIYLLFNTADLFILLGWIGLGALMLREPRLRTVSAG